MNQDYNYDRALAYLQRGQIDQAIETIKGLLANDPNDAHYHGLLARCLLSKKRIYAAEYEIQLALKNNAEIPFLYNTLAHINVLTNKLNQALQNCDESLRLDPEYVDSILLKSDVYLLLNQNNKALQCIDDAAQINPDELAVSLAYGEYYLGTGDLNKANTYAEEVMARDPQNLSCNLLMGQLKLQSGDVKEALRLAKFAILQNPDSSEALALFCDIKVRQNLFLGSWWRFNSKLATMSNTKASMVLISLFLIFNLMSQLLFDFDYKTLSNVFSYGWLILVLYTWVGIPMYQRKLNKELSQFRFNQNF
ncbi:MAG: tetratricopeptide repeat protein [Alcanivoracaceae bacterium]|nr:tetratricopeptide repeat protein [Alcanivoracaceae bacterium]